ncbi:MAG TPA: HIT domain-containing protein [Pyrinomonadaceae bacterium]|nr:HIT domain-containing protein [Pyrinomonadaceae bacterium]
MDVLWSPWRYDYIKGSGGNPQGCVFCNVLQNSVSDEENFILTRAEFNFVILNIYPYTSGHLMIVPYDHLSMLDDAGKQTTDELMDLTKRAQAAISEVYNCDGVNLGMNLGKAAGAGVDGHLHMHVLPRWVGDANFLTAIGQTRSIPESLETTYQKLKEKI